MSQFGLNTGARHANVLGQAKSITKDLDRDTRIDHDMDVIGAVSITWSLICSVMSTEILSEVDDALEADGMPRLASRDVAESKFQHLLLDFTNCSTRSWLPYKVKWYHISLSNS